MAAILDTVFLKSLYLENLRNTLFEIIQDSVFIFSPDFLARRGKGKGEGKGRGNGNSAPIS